jgi:hypothetical protein
MIVADRWYVRLGADRDPPPTSWRCENLQWTCCRDRLTDRGGVAVWLFTCSTPESVRCLGLKGRYIPMPVV